MTEAVVLGIGRRRTFAAALAWPGWCRADHTEEAALDALAALGARTLDLPLEHPSRAKHPWPLRHSAARAAWHALDHAWEIEDRRT